MSTEVQARAQPWLFSPGIDLASFVLPAVVALSIVAAAPGIWPDAESPEWLWLVGVLLVDVAHVWSTAFLTYFDPRELSRHPARYLLVPALGWAGGVSLYGLGGRVWFWRVLAYVAVLHFVRQQYGWLSLYRARAQDRSRAGALIDRAAIYLATLYPLLYWHAHLPRSFAWFMPGDFVPGMPAALADLALWVYVLALGAYVVRAVWQRSRGEIVAWGKHLLIVSTAATWYVGIVFTNSDLAFTVTNVLAHGIPYAVLVFSYARHRDAEARAGSMGLSVRPGFVAGLFGGTVWAAALRFASCLWVLAFVEELLWDRSVWHEREYLFGSSSFNGVDLEALWVPLLALPQWTHYVLDGFFWRRGKNPSLTSWLRRDTSGEARDTSGEARDTSGEARDSSLSVHT